MCKSFWLSIILADIPKRAVLSSILGPTAKFSNPRQRGTLSTRIWVILATENSAQTQLHSMESMPILAAVGKIGAVQWPISNSHGREVGRVKVMCHRYGVLIQPRLLIPSRPISAMSGFSSNVVLMSCVDVGTWMLKVLSNRSGVSL